MSLLLGIDLGTSSVKAGIINEYGRLFGTGTEEYPIISNKPGFAEQDPETWWEAAGKAVRRAIENTDRHSADNTTAKRIVSIGLDGQMHGFVPLGKNGAPLGNAIIWPDRRSVREVEDMFEIVGRGLLSKTAGTAPAAGFMGPTLLWIKRNEPEKFDKISCCLFPKDYIRYKLTGVKATDPSDASASALFNIRKRTWSDEIIELLGLNETLLPPLAPSEEVTGHLSAAAADHMGLLPGIPVVTGCADQASQAVGNGLLDKGSGAVTVGSGGQVFVPLEEAIINKELNVHVFCHAPSDRWYILGAMLTAGLSLRWFRDLLSLRHGSVSFSTLSALAKKIEPGADGLLFLPYLSGERSPVMDPEARGCFVGLTLRHGRGDLVRSIMEGVAFALRQIIETMKNQGTLINSLRASGNGLADGTWLQIVTDVLGIPLYSSGQAEQTCTGAALVAGIGAGIYGGYGEAAEIVPKAFPISEPCPVAVRRYEELYQRYGELYPRIKSLFKPGRTRE